ncbi:penicillin-binding protein activator [Erythrobacter litoralis]|uniref:penicillin-binding protein activator n=1 Tax=Erythrobacter litoralis TaxID=39960 RepID=UPI002435F933|nr:penicillin-binding protein activator [Erythrobacter litoralis]
MVRSSIDRRGVMAVTAAALLTGCSIIPKAPQTQTRPPSPSPTTEPSATALPQDDTRHRVALLVPLSGKNGAVGQSISNATTMAILDTNAQNLRITTYDTARGPQEAARQAIADGNKLILGPLLGSNAISVEAEAGPADVPIISFSNDTGVAGPNVFVMGVIPEQSVMRSMRYVRVRGVESFAVLAPSGEYGDRAQKAAIDATREYGGNVILTERYARSNTSVVSAAERVRARDGLGGVLLADGARLSAQAAGTVKPNGRGNLQIIGTELWSGENSILRASALNGALFSAVSDKLYGGFVTSYEARFGSKPYRIATLGYDAVLLTLNIARDWDVGEDFPTSQLRQSGGFTGVDGPFRFQRDGVVERALEVRQIRDGRIAIVSEAPAGF